MTFHWCTEVRVLTCPMYFNPVSHILHTLEELKHVCSDIMSIVITTLLRYIKDYKSRHALCTHNWFHRKRLHCFSQYSEITDCPMPMDILVIVIYFLYSFNVNVNVISRTALIRNRVSRRVLHVSKITWGVLYLFQEAQTH